MSDTQLNAADLARVYVKMRDAKAEVYSQYREKVERIEAQMELVSQKMLELCESQSATSIRTENGTIIRKVQSRYHTNDWESLFNFVKEHDAFGLLEQRLHQGNTKQFLEEHPDLLPPGLWADNKYVVTVRKT